MFLCHININTSLGEDLFIHICTNTYIRVCVCMPVLRAYKGG